MKCIHCGAETPNSWPYGYGGLCNGDPLPRSGPEHDAAYAACEGRRQEQDNAIRAASVATIGTLVERLYDGLPLALVVVEPVPGDTVTWAIPGESESEVGKVIEDNDIAVLFPAAGRGLVYLSRSYTRDGLVLRNDGGERDGYALWLDTPEKRPGDRSWSIKYRDRRTPQVVAVDVVATVTVRGAT